MGNANTDRRDVLQAERNQQIPAGDIEQRTLHRPRPFTPRHAQRQAVGLSDGEEPDRPPAPIHNARNVNGGISLSTTFMVAQLKPPDERDQHHQDHAGTRLRWSGHRLARELQRLGAHVEPPAVLLRPQLKPRVGPQFLRRMQRPVRVV